jgi:hypothetical protein
MEKNNKIKLTEMFTAKCGKGKKGFDRCFHGTIRREDNVVYGNITVNDGYILATGKDQWELGDKLDELVMFILDHDLHETDCITAINPKFKFDIKQIYMN